MKLNIRNIENVIARFETGGRVVDRVAAKELGRVLMNENIEFLTATDACEHYASRIWNAGLVK